MTFVAILLFAAQAAGAAPPWNGIVAPARAERWDQNAGLPLTFSDGETIPNGWTTPARPTICATVAPEGTAAAPVAPTNIENAIASCHEGQTILLSPAGSYYWSSGPTIGAANNITIRGLGADKTKVYGAGFNFQSPTLNQFQVSWTGGYTQGSTTITTNNNPGVGTMLELSQCDTGFAGSGWDSNNYSTAKCSTGASIDNGALYVQAADPPTGGGGISPNSNHIEMVLVTAVSGNGPYTVTLSRPLYYPDWAAASNPVAFAFGGAHGDGVEDLSIDEGGLYLAYGYGNWVKGVRVVVHSALEPVNLNTTARNLVLNSYFTQQNVMGEGAYAISAIWACDNLILNNLLDQAFGVYVANGLCGQVFAYNLHQHSSGFVNTANNALIEDHDPSTIYNLYEGNEVGSIWVDQIHGMGKFFTTAFRNLTFGTDPPYTNIDGNLFGISLEAGVRFSNLIGNVMGSTASPSLASYKQTPFISASNGILDIGQRPGHPPFADGIGVDSTMIWGNVDPFSGGSGPRWCGDSSSPGWATTCSSTSEVPSGLNTYVGYQQTLSGSGAGPYTATLSHLPCRQGNVVVFNGTSSPNNGTPPNNVANALGNGNLSGAGIAAGSVNCTTGAVTVTFSAAVTGNVYVNYVQQTSASSPWQNPVPAATALPPSFLFNAPARPNGGTGLPFWKVCTNYPTCSSSQTPPFPPIGPDVSGGSQEFLPASIQSFAHDIPAKVAWQHLPIDASYQTSYAVTAASWSSGTQTLTVSGLPYAPTGEFQVTGACAGTYLATSSSATTVSFAAASNPGSCTGGAVLWPDIRQFNEAVYQADTADGGLPPSPPTQLHAAVH